MVINETFVFAPLLEPFFQMNYLFELSFFIRIS